ncbi:MAG: hypothetical protein ABSB75_05100, partial [Candidatus Limnocylindrales bacterium]
MREHGVEFIQGLLVAFASIVILMPAFLRLLRWLGMGKQIREDGPGTHLVKQGTPTMGGVLIVAVILFWAVMFNAFDASTYSPLFVLALVGALGAVDDYLNARTGIGIRGRHKVLWQLAVAIVVAVYVQNHFGFNGFRVPFMGNVVYSATIAIPFTDRGVEVGAILFIVVAVLAIVGCSNGVNLTDGLDGLAGGTLVFAFISFLIIALLNKPLQPNL